MLQELFATMIALLIAWLLSVSATAATQPQKNSHLNFSQTALSPQTSFIKRASTPSIKVETPHVMRAESKHERSKNTMNRIRQSFDNLRQAAHQPLVFLFSVWTLMVLMSWGVLLLTE